VLAVIGGVLGILGSLGLLSLGSINGLFPILGIITLVLSIVSLAFGYGAWFLKPWAWQLGVGIYVARIIMSILFIVLGAATIGSEIISIVIAALIIYYLNQPDIKRAFGRS
jgi:hypothetical protein